MEERSKLRPTIFTNVELFYGLAFVKSSFIYISGLKSSLVVAGIVVNCGPRARNLSDADNSDKNLIRVEYIIN